MMENVFPMILFATDVYEVIPLTPSRFDAIFGGMNLNGDMGSLHH
jgi:hypothetical protein